MFYRLLDVVKMVIFEIEEWIWRVFLWFIDCLFKVKIFKIFIIKLWFVSLSYNYFRSFCIVLLVRVKFVKKFLNNLIDYFFVLIVNFLNLLYVIFIFYSIGLKVVKLLIEILDSWKFGLGNCGVCVVFMLFWL